MIGTKSNFFKEIKKRNKKLFLCFILLFSQISGQENNWISNEKKNILFYSIKTDNCISGKKILRLETLPNILFMVGQTTISYDYCDNIGECMRSFEKIIDGKKVINHYELTGFKAKSDLLWLHPPRSDNFRILELNAFPSYRKSLQTWDEIIQFGSEWGNINWVQWNGFKTAKSIYSKSNESVSFTLENETLVCTQINAITQIANLGNTKSIFYYNEKYGFVYMSFTTINNKKIEFKLIKVLNDSDSN